MSVRVKEIIVSLEIHLILITKIQMMFDDIFLYPSESFRKRFSFDRNVKSMN